MLLPDARKLCSSLIQAKMMILLLESKRKNRRKRRPILARRQCLNTGPMVLPWRNSSRPGLLGMVSSINCASALNSLTLALVPYPSGSWALARAVAVASFCSCAIKQS